MCFVQFVYRVCVLKCFLGWTWIRRERPWRTLWSLVFGVNTLGLSVPLSKCRSHMVGAFSQNRVTLTGLPMILPSESDLLISVWFVLSCTPGCSTRFSTNMVPHCIYDWVLVYLLHNTCVLIDIDLLSFSFWSLSTWM